jgi:hypothetical protein
MIVNTAETNNQEAETQSMSVEDQRFCTEAQQFYPRYAIHDWGQWREYLERRRQRRLPPTEFSTPKRHPIAWSLGNSSFGEDTIALVRRLIAVACGDSGADQTVASEEVNAWVVEADGRPMDANFAIECLAWCHGLPQLDVAETTWWELLTLLGSIAEEAMDSDSAEDPVANLWLGAELPLTIAFLFSELKKFGEWDKRATSLVSESIVELSDGEGMPHCANLLNLRAFVSSWTRCSLMLDEMTKPRLSKDADLQFEWAVRQLLRTTRGDGTGIFSTEGSSQWSPGLFIAAIDVAGDAADKAIVASALPKVGKKFAEMPEKHLPEAAYESEWAEMAFLRSTWSRKGERLSVVYGGRQFVCELEAVGQVIASGDTTPEIAIGGNPVTVESDWEQVCWVSDEDGDYLEVEAVLSNSWKIQRQAYLARDEKFALLSDAVRGGGETADIAYHYRLPMPADVGFRAEKETREGTIFAGKDRARVLPLALPEWRGGGDDDRLAMREDGLHLRMFARNAGALFAPLFIDLDARRFKKKLTWRQLTVAQKLEIVEKDQAAGYRIRIGNQQWLLYRALAGRANRTVLGHNLSTEFLLARFKRSGDVTTMIEIQ